MSNRIDQFFKDKLADVRQAPSADAWSRIESGLTKKNKYVIVWRIAAVLALLGLLFGSLYVTRNTVSPEQELVKDSPEKNAPATQQRIDSLSRKQTQENKLLTTVKEKPQQKPKQQQIRKEVIQNQAVLPEQEKKEEIPNEPILEQATVEQVTVAEAIKTEKPVVIEYTLKSIADTKTEIQTTQTQEKTGLKKLWDAAKDVKNGNSDLGLLRDAKNDLFAFEFRKDKTKRN